MTGLARRNRAAQCTRVAALFGAFLLGLVVVAPVVAQVDYRQVAVITGPDVPSSQWQCLGPVSSCFDISWVDPKTQTYVLGDSANSRLLIADAQHNRFVGQVTGFKGGPSGSLIDDKGFAWASDGNGLAKVNLQTKTIAKTIDTGMGTDELAYDSKDQVILITNPGSMPPYVTLVSTKTLSVLAQIQLTGAARQPEQPSWDPATGLFWLPVIANTSVSSTYLQAVDPLSKTLKQTISLNCGVGQGTAVGPSDQMLVSCFPSGALVVDLAAGSVITTVSGTGAGASGPGQADEVTYNPSEKTYYMAGFSNMEVVDAISKQLIATVSTGTYSHSIAVDPKNNEEFVPESGTGIAVFQRVTSAPAATSNTTTTTPRTGSGGNSQSAATGLRLAPTGFNLAVPLAGLALLGFGGLLRRRRVR